MTPSATSSSLFRWNPFLLWETAQATLAPEQEGRLCAQPLESALPAAVETGGPEDPEMGPSGFTHWF